MGVGEAQARARAHRATSGVGKYSLTSQGSTVSEYLLSQQRTATVSKHLLTQQRTATVSKYLLTQHADSIARQSPPSRPTCRQHSPTVARHADSIARQSPPSRPTYPQSYPQKTIHRVDLWIKGEGQFPCLLSVDNSGDNSRHSTNATAGIPDHAKSKKCVKTRFCAF